MSISEPIRVSCRIRADPGDHVVVRAANEYVQILNSNGICAGNYKFSAVFDQQHLQDEVYEKVAKRVVDRVLGGYNGTIFAYGQTGSGKTHTIVGPSHLKDLSTMEINDRGIIPRSIDQLFHFLNTRKEDLTEKSFNFEMRISYVQYYQDLWYDLLAGNEKIRFSTITGLDSAKFAVSSSIDALKLVQIGWNSRRTAETSMNRVSSRSHCIFIVELKTEELKGDPGERIVEERTSKLCLVDLAGAERVSQTGAQVGDQLFKETITINKSLTHLSTVMQQLAQGQKHISYNNSELTRFLKDSLGGNAITAIVVTIHSNKQYLSMIESTFQFAKWCLNIKNEVQTNMKIAADTKLALLNKVNQLNQQLQQANARIEKDFETRIKNLEEEINEHRKRHEEKDREIVLMETKLRLQTDNLAVQSPRYNDSPRSKRRRTASLQSKHNLAAVEEKEELELENAKIRELLEARENEIQRLIDEKMILEQKIDRQQQEEKEKLLNLDTHLQLIEENLKKQLEDNEKIKKAKDELEFAHSSCQHTEHELREEIEEIQVKLNDQTELMQTEIDELKGKLKDSISEKNSLTDRMQSAIDEHENQLRECFADKEVLSFEKKQQAAEHKVSIEAMEKKNKDLEDQLFENSKQNEQEKTEMNRLRSELRNELNEQTERVKVLEQLHKNTKSDEAFHSAQLEEKVKRLEKNLSIANEQLAEFVDNNQNLEELKSKLIFDKTQLEKKYISLEEEAESLRKKVEKSEIALAKGRDQNDKSFSEERNQNRVIVQKLIAQHKEAFENEQKRQKQIDDLHQQDLEKYQGIVTKLTKQQEERDKNFNQENLNANKEINFHKNRIKDLINESQKLREQVDELNQKFDQLKKEQVKQRSQDFNSGIIQENRKQIDCLIQQIDLLDKKLKEESRLRIATITECHRLEGEVREIRKNEKKNEYERNLAILQEKQKENEIRLLKDALSMANETLRKSNLPTVKLTEILIV